MADTPRFAGLSAPTPLLQACLERAAAERTGSRRSSSLAGAGLAGRHSGAGRERSFVRCPTPPWSQEGVRVVSIRIVATPVFQSGSPSGVEATPRVGGVASRRAALRTPQPKGPGRQAEASGARQGEAKGRAWQGLQSGEQCVQQLRIFSQPPKKGRSAALRGRRYVFLCGK